jgi:hypothetical protein
MATASSAMTDKVVSRAVLAVTTGCSRNTAPKMEYAMLSSGRDASVPNTPHANAKLTAVTSMAHRL